MKKIAQIIIICLFGYYADAQNPIKWSFSAKKISAKNYELHLTANLEKGWYVYSQFIPDGGPSPTLFKYAKNPLVKVKAGKLEEIGVRQEKYDSNFGVVVQYYYNKVSFVQVIELTVAKKTTLKGIIEYMGCNEEMCLPPQFQEFTMVLN